MGGSSYIGPDLSLLALYSVELPCLVSSAHAVRDGLCFQPLLKMITGVLDFLIEVVSQRQRITPSDSNNQFIHH
jgi:hypothetical protein